MLEYGNFPCKVQIVRDSWSILFYSDVSSQSYEARSRSTLMCTYVRVLFTMTPRTAIHLPIPTLQRFPVASLHRTITALARDGDSNMLTQLEEGDRIRWDGRGSFPVRANLPFSVAAWQSTVEWLQMTKCGFLPPCSKP